MYKHPASLRLPVEGEVVRDQVVRRERGHQGELAAQYRRADHSRELLRVGARAVGGGAADAEEVEARGLRLERGAAADGADLDGWHRARDPQVERLVPILDGEAPSHTTLAYHEPSMASSSSSGAFMSRHALSYVRASTRE